MQFKFVSCNSHSGRMAFTGPATSPLLLLTDAGHDAVHVLDVAGQAHVGYVAAPGAIVGPRGVATRGSLPGLPGSLVAISAWKGEDSDDHVVRLFAGGGARWKAVRVVAGGFGGPGSAAGQLRAPYGLRFSGDGIGLAVADAGNGRVSVFRVEDGSFVRHIATGLSRPYDVEEYEGGWLVACRDSHTIEFVGRGFHCGGVGGARLGKRGTGGLGHGDFMLPTALALVQGLALVVREYGSVRLQFFATPGAIAMSTMSAARVGWMVAVARGAAHRASSEAWLGC
jgi:hypothetical protein